jgi:O-antigen ligase
MRKLAFILSLLLIFTIPWEDAVTIAGLYSITRYIGIVAAAAWIVSVLLNRKVRKPHSFHILAILFILWNVASVIWSIALDETIAQIKTYAQLIILILLIWDLYTTSKDLKNAMQAYILGAYVAIFATINNYILGREIKLYSGGRYAGVGNAVDLALILTLGIPIAWYLATSSENQNIKKILRLINLAYIPAGLFAILLTGTRMAIFAVIPAFVYIVVTSNRLKFSQRLLIFGSLICSFWFIQPYIPSSVIARLGTTSISIATGDLGGRVNLWLQSILYFYDNPIIGIGSGAISSPFVVGVLAHNTFLSVLTELGLIGFILFMSMLVVTLKQAIKQNKNYATLWVTILAIWAIGVFTLTWEYRKVTWLILTLIIVGANLRDRQNGTENKPLIIPRTDAIIKPLQ